MQHPSPRADGTEMRQRFAANEFVFWPLLTTESSVDTAPVFFGKTDGAPSDGDLRANGTICVRLNGTEASLYQKSAGVYTQMFVGGFTPAKTLLDGVVAHARLAFPNQPSDTDTISIGADTYEFSSDGTVTAGRRKVDIGVDAATTLASLIVSINTATAAVNASSVGTFLLIQNASAAGGTPTPGVPSVALTEAITDAADVWEAGVTNLNQSAGEASGYKRRATAKITVSAGLAAVSAGLLAQFDFTPTDFFIQIRDTNGQIRFTVTDRFTISGNGILITQNGATHLAATDIVTIEAWE